MKKIVLIFLCTLVFCPAMKAAVWMITEPYRDDGEILRYFRNGYGQTQQGFSSHDQPYIPRIPLGVRYSTSLLQGTLDGIFFTPFPDLNGERLEADRFVALAFDGRNLTALYNDRTVNTDGTEGSVLRPHFFTSDRKQNIEYDLDYGPYNQNNFGNNDLAFNLIHGLDSLPEGASVSFTRWNELNPEHIHAMAADSRGQHIVIYDDDAEMNNKLLYYESTADFFLRRNETVYTLAWDPNDHKLYGMSFDGQYYNLMFGPNPDHRYPFQLGAGNFYYHHELERFTDQSLGHLAMGEVPAGRQYQSRQEDGAHVRYASFDYMIKDRWPLARPVDPAYLPNPDTERESFSWYNGNPDDSLPWDILAGYAESIRGINRPIPEPSSYAFIAALCLTIALGLRKHKKQNPSPLHPQIT